MKGIIAVVDALGVSTFDLEQSQRFIRVRDEIISQIRRISDGTAKNLSIENLPPSFHTIGDTIVISWKAAEDESDVLDGLAWTGTWLRYLIILGLHNNLLFRGAMAYGDYISEENTILGPAVADAVSWYEVGDWFGVICVPSLQFFINLMELSDEQRSNEDCLLPAVYVKYEVPMKNGESKELWTIPWPFDIWALFSRESSDKDTIVRQAKGKINTLLDGFAVPKGTEDKYTNSLKYFDAMLKIYCKQEKEVLDVDIYQRIPSLK